MKLYFANTSPYARKARIAIHELGLQDEVEQVFQNPFEESPDLLAANPLKRVPCLITDDEQAIYDSPVICAYLDSFKDAPRLIPSKSERWSILTGEALADGILDAAYAIVMERRRPEIEQSSSWLERWEAGVRRGVGAVNSDIANFEGEISMAQIGLGAALGYLDFRLPDLDWRGDNPVIAQWYAEFSARPSMIETEPPQG